MFIKLTNSRLVTGEKPAERFRPIIVRADDISLFYNDIGLSTRITLRNGGSCLVEESMEDIERLIEFCRCSDKTFISLEDLNSCSAHSNK